MALVLFAEAITFQQSMISFIVPKLSASFPQAGANVTWSVTILGVAGGATMALVGKLGDLIGKKRVLLICGVLFAIGCLVIPVFMVAVPETPLRARQRFDVLGAVLLGAGVGASLVYLSEGSSWGWGNISCLAYLIGGLVLLAAFITWETRAPEPMMELSLLRAPRVLIVMLTAFLLTAVISMTYIAIAYMFETPKEAQLKQQILAGTAAQSHEPLAVVSAIVHFQGDLSYATAGFSVLALALHITLWTAAFGLVGGPLGGYLARRVGGRLPLLLSCALLLAACALWVPWHKTWPEQVAIGALWGSASVSTSARTPTCSSTRSPPAGRASAAA